MTRILENYSLFQSKLDIFSPSILGLLVHLLNYESLKDGEGVVMQDRNFKKVPSLVLVVPVVSVVSVSPVVAPILVASL
jgi:hypothetical protein